ncbi:MAG TPA: DNA-3-methyladenine glycosylase [Ktedonobacterales bacterium]|nr:DNA-3-methyladenine glycosylase [Ktedonobacterales bacterium]
MSEETWQPLPQQWYAGAVLEVARRLLGKVVAHRTPEGLTAGVIVEVEAYGGADDPASHAYAGQTARNSVMFGPPGRAYVYFTYGMHCCLNVVTGAEGSASAVLLRALEPLGGVALMCARRGARIRDRDLCRGPGRLCQALGVSLAQNGADLRSSDLWIAEAPKHVEQETGVSIATAPRIGITRAADRPWRLYLSGSPYVSGRVR